MTNETHILGLKGAKQLHQERLLEINFEGMGVKDAKEVGETFDAAIEALEKQIPKKPKITLHNGYCGNCGVSWGYDRLKTEEYCGFKYFQYCPICGQAIDWSEEV